MGKEAEVRDVKRDENFCKGRSKGGRGGGQRTDLNGYVKSAE